MLQRLEVNSAGILKSFLAFYETADVEKVHLLLFPDMDLCLLSLEFGCLVACSSSKYLRVLSLCDLVRKLAKIKGVLENAMIAMVLSD